MFQILICEKFGTLSGDIFFSINVISLELITSRDKQAAVKSFIATFTVLHEACLTLWSPALF